MSDATPQRHNYGDVPGNSKKAKEGKPEAKEIKQIVEGQATQKKKPFGKRVMEAFTGDDSRTVGNYVFFELILPELKRLASDAVAATVDRLLFGSSNGTGRGPRRGYTSYGNRYAPNSVPFDKPSSGGRPSNARPDPRAVHDFDDIIIENRAQAEQVIDALNELISAWDVATVADLYQMVGITGNYADDKWGWNSMVGARVDRVRDGYILVLPKTMSID